MAVLVVGAALLPLLGTGPARATTWTVSLSASASDVEVGTSVILTATANQSLTGTGLWIDIFDQTTGIDLLWCDAGSECSVGHSENGAGSHTFIAYVDGDNLVENPPCCVQATSNTTTVRWHARATAAFDVEFSAGGTLPAFPCATGCDATFSGSGAGSGTAHAEAAGVDYAAAFAVPAGGVGGTANYAEPGPPLCPAIGAAVGTVSLSGAATGAVHRTTTPTLVGTVTSVAFTLDYTYQRAASGTVITVTGGTARIDFAFPDTGADYFVSDVAGAGPGAFDVNPAQATSRCSSPGDLPFTVVGDVALTLT